MPKVVTFDPKLTQTGGGNNISLPAATNQTAVPGFIEIRRWTGNNTLRLPKVAD